GVVERMVLDLDREAALAEPVGRALGHGPALERAVHLQAEVVVPGAGVVELHHEDRALAAAGTRGGVVGFRGLAEAALACVLAQAHPAPPSGTLAGAGLLGRLARLGRLLGGLLRRGLLRRGALVLVDALL